jgi:hypothetical protein
MAGLDELYNCKPALMRAYHVAKNLKKGKRGSRDDDYVSRIEFRMLLVYLKLYFELFQIFANIDTGSVHGPVLPCCYYARVKLYVGINTHEQCGLRDDRRVDIDEFREAAPSLKEWGCPIDDNFEVTFNKV